METPGLSADLVGEKSEPSGSPSGGTQLTRDPTTNANEIEWVSIPYDPDEHGFRRIVRNFSPSWFVVTMGTGIVSTLLYQLPYNAAWLRILSTIFFVLNIVLFTTFLAMSGLRYTMYPELLGAMFRHPKQRLFLGTIPTSLFTIINMIVAICVPAWGQGMAIFAWILWWINSAISVALCFYLTLLVIRIPKTDLSTMTSLWLLPLLPAVIASTSGGAIAMVLTDPQHQYWTLVISYVLWGISIPLALFILVLYFYRLTVHEMLDKEVIVSTFLPIGPFGLGGYSLFLFGKVAIIVFPKVQVLPSIPNASEILYIFGFIVSLLMWAFCIFWFFLAIAAIIECRTFPFNMGWWSFTFPIGVFALSTIQIGKELDSSFFKVLGTIFSVLVFLLWILVAAGTIQRSLTGEMFYSPCLETDMKLKQLKIRRQMLRTTGANKG